MAPTKNITTAEPLVPSRPSLTSLREAAAGCQACPLWKTGTQTVFGEGLKKADVMLVGEQPGDKEDLEGRPFVGPAGKLLDKALDEAGIARDNAYVTNVVKHFKWEARGKRRIHKKPNMAEITACKPWLEAELDVVRPKAVVCLGSTAAQALLGRDFKVSRQRGELVDSDMAPLVTATVHPSSILRAPDEAAREQGMREFTRDLAKVAAELYG
jgi:uracil-DNA glycosylase family protein